MPAPLSDANRREAHRRAQEDFGVKLGDLYLEEPDGTRWGPVACGAHRLRIDTSHDAVRGAVPVPRIHQVGEEDEAGYDGYQPDCPECADQVYDTFDHLEAVARERRRAG